VNTNIRLMLTPDGKWLAKHSLPTIGFLLLGVMAGANGLSANTIGTLTAADRVHITQRLAALVKHLPTQNAPVMRVPPGTNNTIGANQPTTFRTPDEQKQWMQEKVHDDQVVSQGEQQLQSGNVEEAVTTFQMALGLPAVDENAALRGLAHCAAAAGDLQDEVNFLRPTIYSDNPALCGTVFGDGYRENNVPRLMEFVLALNQIGQIKEATSVYNRAIGLSNYDGAQLRHKVMLPYLGNAPGQEAYTSQKLQANAHLAIFIDMFEFEGYGSPEPLTQLQQAIGLAPDSAAAHYYLGHYLYGKNDPGAKAELERAIQLGDNETATASKEVLQFVR